MTAQIPGDPTVDISGELIQPPIDVDLTGDLQKVGVWREDQHASSQPWHVDVRELVVDAREAPSIHAYTELRREVLQALSGTIGSIALSYLTNIVCTVKLDPSGAHLGDFSTQVDIFASTQLIASVSSSAAGPPKLSAVTLDPSRTYCFEMPELEGHPSIMIGGECWNINENEIRNLVVYSISLSQELVWGFAPGMSEAELFAVWSSGYQGTDAEVKWFTDKKRAVEQRACELGLTVAPDNPLMMVHPPASLPEPQSSKWSDQFFDNEECTNDLAQQLEDEFSIEDIEFEADSITLFSRKLDLNVNEIAKRFTLANFQDVAEDKIKCALISKRRFESASNRFCVKDEQPIHGWSGISVGFIEQNGFASLLTNFHTIVSDPRKKDDDENEQMYFFSQVRHFIACSRLQPLPYQVNPQSRCDNEEKCSSLPALALQVEKCYFNVTKPYDFACTENASIARFQLHDGKSEWERWTIDVEKIRNIARNPELYKFSLLTSRRIEGGFRNFAL